MPGALLDRLVNLTVQEPIDSFNKSTSVLDAAASAADDGAGPMSPVRAPGGSVDDPPAPLATTLGSSSSPGDEFDHETTEVEVLRVPED